ncbi:arginase family protein [Paenibacillus durus]|uniref:arginase family protein n=1 Tax=Paenibacillus durus TaxID=44251 RepID=UPI001E37D25A|nr:arginase family protein [Paenibacillus durus]
MEKEDGIVARNTLLQQARSAKGLIHKHNPERIVVLGGDCSVELAPFAYLNEKYNGDTALLWVDAHPDVSIPEDFEHHHAHVLANLLGVGDREFVAEVPRFFNPEQVLFVGLNDMLEPLNSEPLRHMKLARVGPDEIKQDSSRVLQWLEERKPSKIMIHFDLDVLDMKEFRSLLVAYPGTYEEYKKRFPQGSSMETIIRVLQDAAKSYEVVGLGITEHFPWDSLFLQNMLSRLPLIGDIHNKERLAFNNL